MKFNTLTRMFVIVSVLAWCVGSAAPAAEIGAACDPKKLQECCRKIQKTIANIDALRAKLVKMESDIKAGKKLTEVQADQVLRTTQQAEDFFANTEGAMTGF